jgi:hypothetical protein
VVDDSSSVRPLRILLVDGTNVGNIAAGGTRQRAGPFCRESVQERFAAWLQFLAAAACAGGGGRCSGGGSGSGAALAAVLVAFDNKGSALTNVRAQLAPSYLSTRYGSSSGRDTQLASWSELSAVVEQLQQQQQQTSASASSSVTPCFLSCQAAYGFEADDVLAAAAAWVRVGHANMHLCCHALCLQLTTALSGRLLTSRVCRAPLLLLHGGHVQCAANLRTPVVPDIVIASSDSDMQQLLADEHTYWLQLQQARGIG